MTVTCFPSLQLLDILLVMGQRSNNNNSNNNDDDNNSHTVAITLYWMGNYVY